MNKLNPHDFLVLAGKRPVIDVRTPKEFEKGHIPGAVNIPLFTNEERAVVGTIYKRKGPDEAVLRGLKIVGPKLADFVEECRGIASGKEVLVHCWRGGMRSSSFAWLLETSGIKADILTGGYKAYRSFIRESFNTPCAITILGGMTGSGKTEILHELRNLGEQVLDLEGLACHKGSAFGFIGQGQQPSNEMFENITYEIWKTFDFSKRIWIEDESLKIGKVVINEVLFKRIREAPLLIIDIPKKIRIDRLEKEYCIVEPGILKGVIDKIERKLGGQYAKEIKSFIEQGEHAGAIDLVLDYYDKFYSFGMGKRDEIKKYSLKIDNGDIGKSSREILDFANKNIII